MSRAVRIAHWSFVLWGFAALSLSAQERPMIVDDIAEPGNVAVVAVSPNGQSIPYTVSAWERPAAKNTLGGRQHVMR